MGFCNCSMFCCALICVHSSFAIILIGKRELVALLCLSSWCLVIIVWLFLTMPQVCLQFVIVVFLIILTYYFCFVVCWNGLEASQINIVDSDFYDATGLFAVCDCGIS